MRLMPQGTVRAFLHTFFTGRPYELFVVLYLDARNRLLHGEEAFRGPLTQASVYAPGIVRRALELRAVGLIFAHQHPLGASEPSMADELLTRRSKEALATVDVKVLDHFVIGDATDVPFA